MFDVQIRRAIDPALERIAHRLVRWGVSADAMTWIGFLLGIAGAVCVVSEWYRTGLIFILLNRLADGLDGCIARHVGPSDSGAYLDIVLDTIFYSAIPLAFAIANDRNALPAAFVIHSFVGTGGSFLAYAIIAAKRGTVADRAGKKSFFYSLGFMEGAETVVFLTAICVLPTSFPVLAWTFGSLCWLTTLLRLFAGTRDFR